MSDSHRRAARRMPILLTLLVLVGGLLAPSAASVRAGDEPDPSTFPCAALLGVKEWTVQYTYSWSDAGTRRQTFDTMTWSEQARSSMSGNLVFRFEKDLANSSEFGARWVSYDISGPATHIETYSSVVTFPGFTSHDGGFTDAQGNVRETNDGTGSELYISAEDCTYNLSLWADGPDGETRIYGPDGEETPNSPGEGSVPGMAFVAENQPIDAPVGVQLPHVAQSMKLPISSDEPQPLQLFGCCWYVNGIMQEEWGRELEKANIFWSLKPSPVREPTIDLDREFLERSIFLDEVHVDHWFDSRVSWGDADSGSLIWKVGERETDRSETTSSTMIRKTEDLGIQGTGNKPVIAQVKNADGVPSKPETTNLWMAPLMDWCNDFGGVTGNKAGSGLSYRCGFKFPEPAFEAATVPSWVPFFKGKPLGIKETQVAFDLEVKSSGEGTLKGSGQTGMEAMGGTIISAVSGKGDVFLGPDGVRIPKGSVDWAISGKLEKKEPLLVVVPAFAGAITWLEGFNAPAAHWIRDRAYVKLEIEPKIAFAFNFKTHADALEITDAEIPASVGFKATTGLELWKNDDGTALLDGRVGVGGELGFIFQLPKNPGYLKKVEVKALAFAQLQLWRFLFEGEQTWTWSFPSGANKMPAINPLANGGQWTIMERPHLAASDYATWTGVSGSELITDQQLMQQVDPLAHPALALGGGIGEEYLVWAHDKPGAPALSGQELAFAKGSGSDWSGGWQQLTNDSRSDFNPRTLALPSGELLVLWQRLDTATPGDLQTNPAGVLSHMQIAAGTFDPSAESPTITPLQLSSGGLSHRHALEPIADGALAIWVTNDASQLLGTAATPDRLIWSAYDRFSGEWSTPAQAFSVPGMLSMSFATSIDPDSGVTSGAIVYVRDMDGDLSDTSDTELFVVEGSDLSGSWAWQTPQRLTANDVADDRPQLALGSSAPQLIWLQGEELRFTDGINESALPFQGQADGLRLVDGQGDALALVWEQLDGHDTRIGYALYDAAVGLWSTPETVQPPVGTHAADGTSAAITSVSPALVSEEGSPAMLVLAYQLAEVEAVTRTLEGVTVPNTIDLDAQHLRIAHIPLERNLHITADDLRASAADGQTTLTAAVHNTGRRALPEGSTIILERIDRSTSQSVILDEHVLPAIGGGGVVTTTFALPAIQGDSYEYAVTVAGEFMETSSADNKAVLGSELAISALPVHYAPESAGVGAVVTGTGAIFSATPVFATLTKDSPDGEVLSSTWLTPPASATEPMTFSATLLNEDLGPGRHTLFWNLDPENALGDPNRENNSAQTSVMVLPDLTTEASLITFGQAAGSSALVEVWVRNTGVYTSTSTTMTVGTGTPGAATAPTLATLSVPAIAPGAIVKISGTLSLGGRPEASTGLRSIFISLDPARAQEEINENNNLVFAGDPFATGGSIPPSGGATQSYLPLVRR